MPTVTLLILHDKGSNTYIGRSGIETAQVPRLGEVIIIGPLVCTVTNVQYRLHSDGERLSEPIIELGRGAYGNKPFCYDDVLRVGSAYAFTEF